MSSNQTAILDRLIVPERADLPADAARYLLALDFGPTDRERMDELAAKSREGRLSPQESDEIQSYHHVSHLLALVQSKARRSLKRAGPTGVGTGGNREDLPLNK